MAKKKTEQKKWPETWQEVTPGCMVFAAGNAANYKTGSWKAQRPVLEKQKCIKCGICYIFCPEGCIQEDAGGLLRGGSWLLQGLRDLRPRVLARRHLDG